MCLNQRFVYNRYDGCNYLVKCGHCDACVQEKANRHVSRIRNESCFSNLVPLFVTLTYDRFNVPYIKTSEVKDFLSDPFHKNLCVYRGSDVISTLNYDDFVIRNKFNLLNIHVSQLPSLRYYDGKKIRKVHGCCGVTLVRDAQLFVKRVKINLVRNGYKEYFSYYYCSEYGSRYGRPHFHFLFYVHPSFYSRFTTIVCKSWPHADLFGLQAGKYGNERKPIEFAKNPSRYVASYINCRSSIPEFLQVAKPFSPFSHFSNGFGCNFSEFTLPSLISKVYNGVTTYTKQSVVDGVSSISEVGIPKYVWNRYFFKFKGYNLLSDDEVFGLVVSPRTVYSNKKLFDYLNLDDKDKIYLRLSALNKRVIGLGVSLFDWAFAYPRAIALLASSAIKKSYDFLDLPFDFERNLFEHFNNIKEYKDGILSNLFLDTFENVVYSENPNFFRRVVIDDQLKVIQFSSAVKHHKVKSFYYEKSDF